MKLQNYLQLRCIIPFMLQYCYIDSKDYICDEIFSNHDLRYIYFSKKEFYNKDIPSFVIVRCFIPFFEKELFLECMEHLRRKLEFLDYDMEDYDSLSEIFGLIEEKINE